ncbi:CG0192-related protein [Microlunatus speluncae]|uniref:CG0192-related protein n=1 Tax=Microlunatus speluncae TaxID=2594267 RepID=UPI00126615AD|nr:hypothetical protein [Microlunatus speluncae]
MALIHAASLVPTKLEALAGWLPDQPWASGHTGDLELLGAYRFDDPEGEVGLETHLVRGGDVVLQVPLSYRGAPLTGAEEALVCTMEHSVLGRRWIYDGCADPVFATMLAAVTLTGVGQSVQFIAADGRVGTRPPTVRLGGGGWITEAVDLSGFAAATADGDSTVLRGDRVELRLVRQPAAVDVPATGSYLTGAWPGQDRPALLATATVTGPVG